MTKITDNKTFREWFYFYIKTIEMTKEEGIDFLSEITEYPKSFFDYLLKSNQNLSEEIYKKLDYLLNNVDRFINTNQQTCDFYKINPPNLEKTKEQLKTKQIKLIETLRQVIHD